MIDKGPIPVEQKDHRRFFIDLTAYVQPGYAHYCESQVDSGHYLTESRRKSYPTGQPGC